MAEGTSHRFSTSNVLRAVLCLALVPSAGGCASSSGEIVEVAASPEDGFHFPYFIWLPRDDATELLPFLLVEPNNTGTVSDDFEIHRLAARKMAEGSSIGHFVAQKLRVPFLVPVFPRPETDWHNYTHALDRDTMLLSEGPLVRIDRQLAAMIRHAQSLLKKRDVKVHERVLMTGFSASGTFSNRFAFLHPELVLAAACGGINAIPMLPVERLGGTRLPYPLGLADFASVSGHEFRREVWNAIPQFLYMGAEDDNDAVDYTDGYSDEEREIVHTVIGATMMPDRWDKCREIYEGSGGAVTLRTYDGIGHGTDRRINLDVVEFFRSAVADAK